MDHINALPAGTRLQEYTVREVLGAGGFGITYRADDTNLNKVVAIKEYLPSEFATRANTGTVVPNSSADTVDYEWGLSRFLDEARTLARFDHPHLNKVYRFFEGNGTAYMVLEYVEGQTVSALLTRYTTLPDAALQRLIHEVLSGLEEMHAAGYIHRDLKPGNLMVRSDGSAVVLDFGAARQAVGQRSKSVTAILTPGYAPIEQYSTKAGNVGPWTDLYALGMVAYRCVSGITEAELPDAVTRSLNQRGDGQDLTPAAAVGKDRYDARLLAAIDWAIRVNKEDRPQSVAQWRKSLPSRTEGRVRPAREALRPSQNPTEWQRIARLARLARHREDHVQSVREAPPLERVPDASPPKATLRQVPTKSSEQQNAASEIRPKKVGIAVNLLYFQCGIAALLAFIYPEWLWGQELLWGIALVSGMVAYQYKTGKGLQGHGLLYYVLLLPRFVWSLFSGMMIATFIFVMPIIILAKSIDGSLSSRILVDCMELFALLPGVIAWALWGSERK